MTTRRFLCVVALILVPFMVTSCVWITRSSVPASSVLGTEGDRESGRPSLSQTGRFVAFDSTARNLVENDTNGVADVFVRDHRESTTERVSVATDGAQANGASRKASISDDGRFVVFETDATNLFAQDTDGKTDIVVRDRQLGTTVLVSLDSSGHQITDAAIDPVISGNGQVVAFNINASSQGFCCVVLGPYIRNLSAGTTTRMPTPLQGFASAQTTVSDDGTRAAYGTVQFPTQPEQESAPYAVVVTDVTSASIVATVDFGVLSIDVPYFDVALSGDGTKVAVVSFASGSATLSRYDLNQPGLHPVLAGLVSPARLALSDHGTVIAMRTIDSGSRYVVTDPQGSTPTTVTTSAAGTVASSVNGTDLSGDGLWVAFDTPDARMVSGDANGVSDVYTRSVGVRSTGPS